jgi:hypothetical protein
LLLYLLAHLLELVCECVYCISCNSEHVCCILRTFNF